MVIWLSDQRRLIMSMCTKQNSDEGFFQKGHCTGLSGAYGKGWSGVYAHMVKGSHLNKLVCVVTSVLPYNLATGDDVFSASNDFLEGEDTAFGTTSGLFSGGGKLFDEDEEEVGVAKEGGAREDLEASIRSDKSGELLALELPQKKYIPQDVIERLMHD